MIGAGASIGVDTVLIAPITVGARAYTGSGAVVNRDVPADALVVGVPAHLLRMLNTQDASPVEQGKDEKE